MGRPVQMDDLTPPRTSYPAVPTGTEPPAGAPPGAERTGDRPVQRLKPNAIGLFGVLFMAVATAAPITAMVGNVPIAIGFGNGSGAPAGYLVAIQIPRGSGANRRALVPSPHAARGQPLQSIRLPLRAPR